MAQTSRFWDGTSGGDATVAPYDAATEFAKVLSDLSLAGVTGRILTGDTQVKGGVFRGVTDDTGVSILGQLAVSGSATPVSISSGRAMVAGTWYENSTTATLTVSTPAASTRIDRVVLRKDWNAKTVRLALVAGAEGGAAPTLTRTWGTTWEISLAQVSVTTGGVITVTDERPFLGSGIIYRAILAANAATIDIPSIPSIYDSLEVHLRPRVSSGTGTVANVFMRMNNSASALYDDIQVLYGDGVPVGSSGNFQEYAQTKAFIGCAPVDAATAGIFGDIFVRLADYARVENNNSFSAQSGFIDGANSVSFVGNIYGQYRSNAAVNRLTFLLGGSTVFIAGTSIEVRGVPAP